MSYSVNPLLQRLVLLVVIGLLALPVQLLALQKTPRPPAGKTADSSRLVVLPKPGATKPLAPIPVKLTDSTRRTDTTRAKPSMPTRFNDFRDANKNGIDDRVEKPTSTKKPIAAPPATTKQKSSRQADSNQDNNSTTITKSKKSK